jgi:hypothetical protein
MITLRASRSAAVPVAFMPLLMAKLYSTGCRSCQAGDTQQSGFGPGLRTGRTRSRAGSRSAPRPRRRRYSSAGRRSNGGGGAPTGQDHQRGRSAGVSAARFSTWTPCCVGDRDPRVAPAPSDVSCRSRPPPSGSRPALDVPVLGRARVWLARISAQAVRRNLR